jgi:signal transduction histidine kinase
VRPATDADSLLVLLDQSLDGLLLSDAGGRVVLVNRPFREAAETLGLALDGVFADRLLELADRTTQPYAFAAAVERLREVAGLVEFEDAVAGRVYELHAAAEGDVGRAWTLRDVTRRREEQRARDDRVAAVGHELRTPLTSMTGFIELLSDGAAGPLTPEQARYLEIVGRAAARLQALVGELVEEGRESG